MFQCKQRKPELKTVGTQNVSYLRQYKCLHIKSQFPDQTIDILQHLFAINNTVKKTEAKGTSVDTNSALSSSFFFH